MWRKKQGSVRWINRPVIEFNDGHAMDRWTTYVSIEMRVSYIIRYRRTSRLELGTILFHAKIPVNFMRPRTSKPDLAADPDHP